jgi:hypothetical protein
MPESTARAAGFACDLASDLAAYRHWLVPENPSNILRTRQCEFSLTMAIRVAR